MNQDWNLSTQLIAATALGEIGMSHDESKSAYWFTKTAVGTHATPYIKKRKKKL